jgi:hypothetical protein
MSNATKIRSSASDYFQFGPFFDGKFLKLSDWKNFLRQPLLSVNKYRSIGPVDRDTNLRSPIIKKEQTWETIL